MSDRNQVVAANRGRSIRWSIAALVVCCLGWFCTCFVVNPFNIMGRQPRSAARWHECRNNLHEVGLALHNYHDVYGSFPPAYTIDKDGRPMHSWRVLVLPYLDCAEVYNQYRFDEPWDSEHNISLADAMPKTWSGAPEQPFRCPEADSSRQMETSYVAVIGPETAWPATGSRSISEMTDGTSNTILIIEVADSGIHWMEPRDLSLDTMAFDIVDPLSGDPPDDRLRPSSRHIVDPPELYRPKTFIGVCVLMGDGRAEYLRPGDAPDQIRALLTSSGDENVNLLDR